LKKQDGKSWAVLEKTEKHLPIRLTFGVSGRVGTVGSNQVVLDPINQSKAQP